MSVCSTLFSVEHLWSVCSNTAEHLTLWRCISCSLLSLKSFQEWSGGFYLFYFPGKLHSFNLWALLQPLCEARQHAEPGRVNTVNIYRCLSGGLRIISLARYSSPLDLHTHTHLFTRSPWCVYPAQLKVWGCVYVMIPPHNCKNWWSYVNPLLCYCTSVTAENWQRTAELTHIKNQNAV